MTLRVAVQMDPMENLSIGGDSSFALMLSAQARGYRLWHYGPDDLTYANGRVRARAHPVTVRRVAGDHFSFGEAESLDLGADVDVVLMRQDPPFDLGYITATHLLERIQPETLVVNDPAKTAAEYNGVPPVKLPTTFFSPERGTFIARDKWSREGVMFQFDGRQDMLYQSHDHADRGNFMLFANGRPWVVDGWRSTETKYHSAITIDGRGQGYFAE